MSNIFSGVSGKYDVLAIDPPWPIVKMQRKGVRPNQGSNLAYPTMPIDEIKELPVGSIAAENSWCFMWTVHKYFAESFSILEGWGFKYHITATWDKGGVGMCLAGWHRRSELLIAGYRGTLDKFPSRKAFPTVFTERAREHSRKPDVFYEYASRFGTKRIDIFSREKRTGWDQWGNDCDYFK